MMHLGEELRKKRKRLGMTIRQVAASAGVDKDTISKAERSESFEDMQGPKVRQIMNVLGIEARQLVAPDQPSGAPGIPLLEGLPASPPRLRDDAQPLDDSIPRRVTSFVGLTSKGLYACIVRGDSMKQSYPHGSVVLLDPDIVEQRGVESNRIYAVWLTHEVDDGATLKRIKVKPDGSWVLESENPDIEDIAVRNPADQIKNIALVRGKIVVDEDE